MANIVEVPKKTSKAFAGTMHRLQYGLGRHYDYSKIREENEGSDSDVTGDNRVVRVSNPHSPKPQV